MVGVRFDELLKQGSGSGIVPLLLHTSGNPVARFSTLRRIAIFFFGQLKGGERLIPSGCVTIDGGNTILGNQSDIRRRIACDGVRESLEGLVVFLKGDLGLGFLSHG